jgi:serine/threonine-protein kinase RsbW
VQIKLSVSMPREEGTLPLIRHLVKYSLFEIGVTRDCISDVELALTEACANVVTHSAGDDQYLVDMTITADRCEIRIIDTGHGLDFESLGHAQAELEAESGRGIQLMRALVDNIRFESQPETGTVVHLVKSLQLDGAAPSFITAQRAKPAAAAD